MAPMTPTARPIAYISSRFPVLREAFIIREVRALERSGVEVQTFSLKSPQLEIGNRDFEALRRSPYYSPHLLSWALLRDNLSTLLRRPWQYKKTMLAAAWRFRRHPVQALKCIALFPKMVHYGCEMKRQGVSGVVAAWASLPALAALVAHRLFDLPFGITCRAWDIFVPMNQSDLPAKIAAAAVVRTNNDAGAEFMRQFCSTEAQEEKIRRVYNPFDVMAIERRQQRPEGAPLLVSGGSLVEQKGLRHLLDALALLKQRGETIHLRVIGEGSERERLEAQARELGLTDQVTFVGTLPNHQVLDEMRAAHAFVLPSVPAQSGCMDGIPNVIIEAMALGVPCISTAISGIPELILNDECGLLVPPGEAQPLAEAIQRLLRDDAMQGRFAEAGRARVESLFEMERNAQKLITIYREVGLLS
jgi:glycosyltransferase involved in cell wall biosynthesis